MKVNQLSFHFMHFIINHRIKIELPLSKLLLATITSAFLFCSQQNWVSNSKVNVFTFSSHLTFIWRCVFRLRHFEVVTPCSLLGGYQPSVQNMSFICRVEMAEAGEI